MQITPGYNFEPNEVPTRAKLGLMTTGMQVRGIDISQIATTLIGKITGDTGTSLPGEGWLQISPQGALWVKNRWGRAMFYRAGWGGMETNRFTTDRSLTLTGFAPSRPCSFFAAHPTGSAPSTSPSSPAMQFTTPAGTNNLRIIKALETGQTNTHTRFLLWGGAVTSMEMSMTTSAWVRFRLASLNTPGVPANDGAGGQPIPYSASNNGISPHGIIVSIDTCVTTAYSRALVWEYGHCMYVR